MVRWFQESGRQVWLSDEVWLSVWLSVTCFCPTFSTGTYGRRGDCDCLNWAIRLLSPAVTAVSNTRSL
jgi:hypothetical protein